MALHLVSRDSEKGNETRLGSVAWILPQLCTQSFGILWNTEALPGHDASLVLLSGKCLYYCHLKLKEASKPVDSFWDFCFKGEVRCASEKAMAPHSNTRAWRIPWTEEPGRLQSMGSLRVGHVWATSFSLFTFINPRRNWQPTPVFLPGESQGQGSLVGCRLWGSHRVGQDWSGLAAGAAGVLAAGSGLYLLKAPYLRFTISKELGY